MVVAHRGGAALELENTIEAFRNAIMHRVDAIELDVHLSNDGILIVHHDPVVVDTDGKKIAIRELDAAYVSSLIIGDNQHIPTLREVLTLIKETCNYPLTLFVEIKVDENKQRYPLIEEKVLALLDEFSMIKNSLVLSFDFPTLTTIKSLDSEIHTSALISKTYLKKVGVNDVGEIIEDLLTLKVSSVGIKDAYISSTLIEALHGEDILVGVWTVNTERQMKKFINLNVNFITTDDPVLLMRVLR